MIVQTPEELRKAYNDKADPPDKISVHSAHKVIRKGYVKAHCRTDCCGICEGDGKPHTAAEIAAHEEHVSLAALQRRGFNNTFDNPPEGFLNFLLGSSMFCFVGICTICFDFKEKERLPMKPVQVSRNFYIYQSVSFFSFCASFLYKQEKRKRIFTFLSENITQDSNFVCDCICILMELQIFAEFRTFIF
jgi:hypothetical protein